MREAVDRIEALIHQEVGRNIEGLFAAAHGGLWHAASDWPPRQNRLLASSPGSMCRLARRLRQRPTDLSAPRCWPVR